MIANKITRRKYKVICVGAGVSGTAYCYGLFRYTNIRDVLLLEKRSWVAQVNSHPLNNAQTRHCGDTETNYDLPHALQVRTAAAIMDWYIEQKNDPELSQIRSRMVLATTKKEVKLLEERYPEFKPYYPGLELIYWDEIEKTEPKVTLGRKRNRPLCALRNKKGVIVNYQKLSEHLFEDARTMNPDFDYAFNCPVVNIHRENGLYVIEAPDGVFEAETVVFNAGSYSLYYARELGYGMDYAIGSVGGDFFSAGYQVDNKVYRPQVKGRPFAEIHIDPDILRMNSDRDSRLGPTTLPLPLMERHHYETFKDFMHLPLVTSWRGITSLLKIIRKRKLFWYVAKNLAFRVPVLGKALFLLEAKKIIPTIRYRDLKYRKGAGGIRPQIVNLKTGDFEMGDASIVGNENGDKLIFNTTPSPGASKSLDNGLRDARETVRLAGHDCYFDEEKYQREIGQVLDALPAA